MGQQNQWVWPITRVCVDPLTNAVQFGITILAPQAIISGETDFHVVDSVGELFPDVEVRILWAGGSEADVNEAGELYVRSEHELEQRERNAGSIRRWLGTYWRFSSSGPEWLPFVSWFDFNTSV